MTRQRKIVKLDKLSIKKYESAIINLGVAIRKIDEIFKTEDISKCKERLELLMSHLKKAKNQLSWVKEIEEHALKILLKLKNSKNITKEEYLAFQETLNIKNYLDGFITIVQQCQGKNIAYIHENISLMKPKLVQFMANLNRLIVILKDSIRGLQDLPRAA